MKDRIIDLTFVAIAFLIIGFTLGVMWARG